MGRINTECPLVIKAKEIIDGCDTYLDINDKIEKAKSVLEYAENKLRQFNNSNTSQES